MKTLERVLSKAGLGSRGEARIWVHAGRVKVNGKVTRNPDHWVDMERDRVRFDDKPLATRDRVYLLLYKPTGYLTTYKDPESRPTVYDLVADVGAFLRPVGRLDLDTSGLLLMTNDNQFAERVTNPESHVPKTYLVKASKVLTDEELQRLRDGIELADGPTRPATVKRLRDSGKYTHFEMTLTEGRNRQVRRMVEALGARVLKLVRVKIGPIAIGTLCHRKVAAAHPRGSRHLQIECHARFDMIQDILARVPATSIDDVVVMLAQALAVAVDEFQAR